MRSFLYTFEDFPLAVVNGIEAGFINGQAKIEYSGRDPQDWGIADITLEGFGERVNGKRQWPQVTAPKAIADIIRNRLSNEWSERVDSAVQDQIDADYEAEADNLADMRREERWGAF